ncbi:TonB-dependent siderophore receptor [Conservatibacter flavescens]|uniref:TonB-dependent siderophore receptor n=1 Tax=Conservatibacter flavescens TaxID=28161 RepID=A0A2M8S2X7_9PAST|nr:TonB-dependent siderophore receptor [Conservatibacter flavescens]PJG85492.1 TonB-dependent siderophore receptor [Conservatibacter flavescens]
MKKYFVYSATATAVMLAMQPVFAEQNDTEALDAIEVVGSMNKLEINPFEQAKSVTVMNQAVLQEQHIEKADELGRYQAGFTNQAYGSDTNTNWFRIRGTDATQSIDGTPILQQGFYQPHVETFGLEAVEIIKGADSMTYGAALSGGLINYISKRPHKDQIGQGEVTVFAGNKNQRGVGVDYTGRLNADNSLRYRVVGAYSKTDGDWAGTWNETYYFAPSLTWDISERTQLTLLGSVQKDVGAPSSNFVPMTGSLIRMDGQKVGVHTNLGDPSVDTETNKQYSLGYEFSHKFTDDITFSSNYRYTYIDNYHLGTYVWSYVDPTTYQATRDAVFNDGKATSHSADNRLTWNAKFNEHIDNTLVVGVDYRYQKTDGRYQSYAPFPQPSPVTPSLVNIFNPNYGVGVDTSVMPHVMTKNRQTGFYLQDSVKLFNTVGISAGIRHDRAKSEELNGQSIKKNHTSYSGSIMYYSPMGLNPYFAYSESFRLPSGLSGTQRLYDPQTTQQYEVGVKYLPTWFDGLISVAAYKAKDKGALVSNTNGTGNSVSGDTADRKGIEVQVQGNITDNVSAQLAYTYQTRFDKTTSGNYYNPLYAKHNASVRVAYNFTDGVLSGLTAGAGVRYVGKSKIDGASWVSYKGTKVPSYTVVDLFARYTINENWSAQVNLDNVGNRKYIAACDGSYCYYGEGISGTATVSYKF